MYADRIQFAVGVEIPANIYGMSVVTTTLSPNYGITNRTEKNYDFWRKLRFYLKSHLMVGQTAMYLVSLESPSKLQENGV